MQVGGTRLIFQRGNQKKSLPTFSVQSHSKLRELELKITKNDDDVIRFRREVIFAFQNGFFLSFKKFPPF